MNESLTKPIVIKNLAHLKEMAATDQDGRGGGEFAISLGGGVARSSKSIKHYTESGEWDVLHSISDTYCEYATDEEFKEEEPNIMEAIENGALAFLFQS